MNVQTLPKTTLSLVTGRGQSDTHAIEFNDGRKNPHPSAGHPYAGLTGAELTAMIKNPPTVPKEDAQWIIPSDYKEFDARSHDVQRRKGNFWLLVLDVDDNNLEADFVLQTVQKVVGAGTSILLYSTRSARPDLKKWRAVVPLKNAIAGVDYTDTAQAYFDLLLSESEGELIPDDKLRLPGQVFYLPNRGEFYEYRIAQGNRLSLTDEHPIIARREANRKARAEAEAEAARERARRAAERAARSLDGDKTPVDAFNERHSVADLLERYGYKREAASNDWRSPYQSSGSYATRDYGDYWISLSGSDAAAEIGNKTANGHRHGDAFDLYCHFEHSGNFKRAASAYAKEIDLHGHQQATLTIQLLRQSAETPEPVEDDVSENVPEEVSEGEAGTPWIDAMVKNARGKPLFNTANMLTLFELHPRWKGIFAFDEFRQVKVLTGPIPGSKEPQSTFKTRDLKDADVINAVAWLNRNGFPEASKTVVFDAIETTMQDNTYHPVRKYLNSLPAWDGVPRIASWLVDYCDVATESDDHARYISEIGMRWLISAVARVITPGCKADGVLILEGTQGALKSTTLRTLAGDEWFGDALPPMSSKDASDYLRGKWIIELAELSNINKSEVEVVKAFISREEERFRPAYGRNEISYPRQCVFSGSTNKQDYLRDETGNRRFWPVRVGKRCNVEAIKQDRNMIWAEALHMFRHGEKWWLPEDVVSTAKEQQEKRVAEDAWQSAVMDFANGQQAVSPTQVAHSVLLIGLDKMDRLVTNRITAILTANGWVRTGRFTSGDYKGQAKFERGQE